jgi:hypothetical protein
MKRINGTTLIKVNKSTDGETIEMKINRIVNNGEPIKDGAPLIYTDRKDGIQPDYDIRSDRFEYAIDAMDKLTKGKLAKRAEYYKPKEENKPTETVGEKPMKIGE